MIIGITGKKRSGKDTVASLLGYEKRSFADPLKKACQVIFSLSDDQLEGDKEEVDPRWGVSSRKILQIVGTELFRNTLPNYMNIDNIWIESAKMWLERNKGKNVIFTDVRFLDEARFIKKAGGIILRVVRDLENKDTHSSETETDKITADYTIYNNSSLEDLANNQVLKTLSRDSLSDS